MAVIETKYSVGDKVFYANITTEKKQHPCPDCKGSRAWAVSSPAGGEYTIPCPRCAARFLNDRDLSLDYSAFTPFATRMTIGSVQFNSATSSWDSGARYMCAETGVGSGSVYPEDRLFLTEEEALVKAQQMADKENATSEWIVKLYDRSLEISEYQLESAGLKLARDAKSRAGHMLWNLSDLFGRIEEVETKEEILEAIGDYKKYDWNRDKGQFEPPAKASDAHLPPAASSTPASDIEASVAGQPGAGR
jgi:hypothetical protein